MIRHQKLLEHFCDAAAILTSCIVDIASFFLFLATPSPLRALGIWNIALGSIAGMIIALIYEYLIRDHLFPPVLEFEDSTLPTNYQDNFEEVLGEEQPLWKNEEKHVSFLSRDTVELRPK